MMPFLWLLSLFLLLYFCKRWLFHPVSQEDFSLSSRLVWAFSPCRNESLYFLPSIWKSMTRSVENEKSCRSYIYSLLHLLSPITVRCDYILKHNITDYIKWMAWIIKIMTSLRIYLSRGLPTPMPLLQSGIPARISAALVSDCFLTASIPSCQFHSISATIKCCKKLPREEGFLMKMYHLFTFVI